MIAPLFTAAPYLTALGGQALRFLPQIMRFGWRPAARAAVKTNNLFRTMATGTKAGMQKGAQRLQQLTYRVPNVSQSLIEQSPLLAPFVGSGVEYLMKNSPKSPSPPQEFPVHWSDHEQETLLNKKDPQDLKPHINEQMQPLETAPQAPPRELTDAEKFLQSNTYKFFQSDAYQKLKDIFAGMAESSSDGSGWDALASGVKRLNEGDKQRGQVNQTVEYLKSKGYSEEEARFMARNPQMLNELFTQKMNVRSSSQQNMPKLSDDYNAIFNPDTNKWEAEVVKGSKRYEEQKENIIKQRDFFKSELDSQNTNIRLLKMTEDIVQSTLTATNILSPLISNLPNNDASIIKSNIEAIKKNLARDTLDEMKRKSPNGASGYGNMNLQEFMSLQTRLGNLDPKLSRKVLLGEIQAIKNAVLQARRNTQKLLDNWNIQHDNSLQELISQFPHVKSKDDENRLPNGKIFIDGRGYVARKGN